MDIRIKFILSMMEFIISILYFTDDKNKNTYSFIKFLIIMLFCSQYVEIASLSLENHFNKYLINLFITLSVLSIYFYFIKDTILCGINVFKMIILASPYNKKILVYILIIMLIFIYALVFFVFEILKANNVLFY